MTARDAARLGELGIRVICDLRSAHYSQKRPARVGSGSGIRVVNIPLHDAGTYDLSLREVGRFLFRKGGEERFLEFNRGYYRHFAFERTEYVRDVMALVADGGNLPVLIHCAAGKDRTGFVVAVIQLLLGVPYPVVLREYLRTNDQFRPRLDRFIRVLRLLTLFQVPASQMRVVMAAHAESLDEIHGAVVEEYGSVEQYLRMACRVETGIIEGLRARLLEPAG